MDFLNFTDKYPSLFPFAQTYLKKRENCDQQKFICISK
jgi:hypothetical protein